MDNFSFHKGEKVRAAIEIRVAKLTYSSPYSPELNTIEEMWSKIKAFLRKVPARTKLKFHSTLVKALMSVTKSDLFGWFKHSRYIEQSFMEAL